jgi:hypothetical protein
MSQSSHLFNHHSIVNSTANSEALYYAILLTASVVLWSEFLAKDPEIPGTIPGATRFSE